MTFRLLALAVTLVLGDGSRAAPPVARLRELDPAMAVRSFGRSGACDALMFTSNEELLGVGDDKVVHRWAVTDGRLRYLEPYLWNTFRETRGSIYALALSEKANLVAVAGYGRFTADVSVLATTGDRAGGIVHGLSAATHPNYRSGEAVWALAFDATGSRVAVGHDDGSVWVWNLAKDAVQQVAKPKADKAKEGTRVLWVGFVADRVRFVRADGGVFDAPADGPTTDPEPTWSFENGPLYQVRASADARTFVASPLKQTNDGSILEVRDDRGQVRGRVPYNREKVVNRVAIDAAGSRVAVGLKNAAQEGRTFFQWADGSVEVFDITGSQTRKVATSENGLGFAPEALAFDPTGARLAVAAGPDHETSLWAIHGTTLKPTSVQSGVGSSVWELRVSVDGFTVGFRDRPALDPKHPNARGDGPWRVFDLKARQWHRADPPTGTALATANGWTVEFDPKDETKWTLKSADGTFKYPIVLDPLRDERPICYTFLPPKPDSAQVRIAVGHYWGFSVFEAGPGEKPRRVRCASGHAGYVTAIVPAADGKLLFTASRDHTIAVWSTDDWRHQGELGAAFGVEENKLVVKEVDPGSPAWEAGLLPRDRIDRLIVDRAEVAKSTEWLDRLGSPVPGHEIAFVGTRPGGGPVEGKTVLFQRPQWRFFPTRDDEWILYRYQDFYYDCSTNGDAYLGWLVGGKTAADSPRFFPAEQYRKLFHQPEKVKQLLERFSRNPGEPFSPDVLPPTIAAKLSAPAADGSVDLDFSVTPRKKYATPDQAIPLEKVELWLGDTDNLDHLFWERVPERPGDVFTQAKLTIPSTLLRNGKNRLVVAAYAQGVRTERAIDFEAKIVVRRARNLRGLVVGIDAYPGGKWKKLDASVADATAMHAAFKTLADARFFDAVTFEEPLLNKEATPEAIFKAIDKLAAESGPDDWTMIFLAGHGHGKVRNGVVEPGTWYFVGYNPDTKASAEVSGKAIFDKLKAAKGRKLIFLDACHSGAADESRVGDGARDLRPDGKGPVVLTAATPDQFAWEAPIEVGGKVASRGFFSTGLGESLNYRRSDADRDGDGILTIGEVFLFTRNRVRELVQQYEKSPQTVQMSPNPLWGLPVTRVKRLADKK